MWNMMNDNETDPIGDLMRKVYGLELGEDKLPDQLALLLDALYAQDSARKAPRGDEDDRRS